MWPLVRAWLALVAVVVVAAILTVMVVRSITGGEGEDDPPSSVPTDLGARSHDTPPPGYYDGSCPDASLPECVNAPPPPSSAP